MAITASNTQFYWGKVGERWELTVTKSAEQQARESAGGEVATFVGASVVLKFGSGTENNVLMTFDGNQGISVTDAQQDSLTAIVETYEGVWDSIEEPSESRTLSGQAELRLANNQLQVEQGLQLKVLSSY